MHLASPIRFEGKLFGWEDIKENDFTKNKLFIPSNRANWSHMPPDTPCVPHSINFLFFSPEMNCFIKSTSFAVFCVILSTPAPRQMLLPLPLLLRELPLWLVVLVLLLRPPFRRHQQSNPLSAPPPPAILGKSCAGRAD